MIHTSIAGTILLSMAVIFVSLTLRNHLAAERKLTPVYKTWLRIAVIFAAVNIALAVLAVMQH